MTSRTDAALAAIAVARILELLPWSGLLLYGLLYGLLDLDPLLGLAAVGFFMVFMGLIVVSVAGVHWGPAVARLLPGRLGGFASRTAASLQAVRRRPDLVLVALGLGYKMWCTKDVTPEMLAFPQYKFVIMATLDGFGTFFTFLGVLQWGWKLR